MRNFIIIPSLLCSLSWVSVSAFESQVVQVQYGENVTLLCSNFSSAPAQIIWFKLVNRSQISCVSSIFKPHEPANPCQGYQNGKFGISSNLSTVFLHIRQVNISDSGLYFCGYYISRNPLFVSAAYLEVQDVFNGKTNQITFILAGVTVFLVMVVICQAVRIKKLQKACAEGECPQPTEIQMDSDELNYAVVSFKPKTKRNHRSAPEESNVSYTHN